MPRYDFRCSKGTVIESVEKMDVVQIACTCCAGVARRLAVYLNQTIRGETCPKGNARPGTPKDKYDRHRLDLMQEASEELSEQGVTTSQMSRHGIDRARQMGAPMRAG